MVCRDLFGATNERNEHESIRSSCDCVEFPGLVAAEIGDAGAVETTVFVDGSVDFGVRKNEPKTER